MKRKLAAVGVGIVIALAAAEVGARIIMSNNKKPAGPDVSRGEISLYKPHHHIDYVVGPNAPAMLMRGPHNSLGFRGPELIHDRKEVIRVACVGGSTTYGTKNINESDCWPRKLEKYLREVRPRVEVLNAGVPAYTSAESIQSLREQILPLEPDLIIFYGGANDVMPRFAPNFRSDYAHYRKTWAPPDFGSDEADGPIALWNLLKPRVQKKQEQIALRALTSHRYDESVKTETKAFAASNAKTFARNIRTMVDAARGSGANVLLATQAIWPDGITKDFSAARAEFFRKGLAENAEIIRKIAQETGVAIVDLEALITNPAGFQDFCHHNALGADLVARAVAKVVVAEKLLERRSPK